MYCYLCDLNYRNHVRALLKESDLTEMSTGTYPVEDGPLALVLELLLPQFTSSQPSKHPDSADSQSVLSVPQKRRACRDGEHNINPNLTFGLDCGKLPGPPLLRHSQNPSERKPHIL